MSRFDWPGLVHAGLHGLRLTPAQFWALTPVELQIMLGVNPGNAPMDRGRLDQLQRSFPDRSKELNDG